MITLAMLPSSFLPPPKAHEPVFTGDILAKVVKSRFYNTSPVVEASVDDRVVKF